MKKGTITKTKLKGSSRFSWGYVFDAGKDENGKRRQVVRRGFDTQKKANDALEEELRKRKHGFDGHKDLTTFEAFFRIWLEQHGAKNWGKANREANDKRAAYAIRTFGDVPLSNLGAERIEQDLGTLLDRGGRKTKEHPKGKPLSPKTVREIAALVSQALDKAVTWKRIECNPMDDVDRPKADKKEVEIFEPDGYEKILNRVQSTRYYALCVFAAAAGCRRGEQLALQWPDIDPKSGVVAISKSVTETKGGLEIKSTKSGKTRFVRISQTTIQILLEHKAQLEEEKQLFGRDYKNNNLVFPTPDGDYYVPKQVSGRIAAFIKQAGVKGSLHTLRHFNASLLLSKHVPITVVSKRLGHANSQVTLDIYSHAMKSDEVTAAKLWDEATEDIITRTRNQPQKNSSSEADVISCDRKGLKKVVNH
jgi:integrase